MPWSTIGPPAPSFATGFAFFAAGLARTGRIACFRPYFKVRYSVVGAIQYQRLGIATDTEAIPDSPL